MTQYSFVDIITQNHRPEAGISINQVVQFLAIAEEAIADATSELFAEDYTTGDTNAIDAALQEIDELIADLRRRAGRVICR